jgi:L-fuculose-phosphate aldolase
MSIMVFEPTTSDLDQLRQEVCAAAQRLAASGIMSRSQHGNWSIRIPGTDRILLTGGGSFAGLRPEHVALVDLDGKLLDGEISPVSAEIVHMHTAVYRKREDVGSVLHTHSPYATAFAVASRPIECWAEALVRAGIAEAVPVAAYAPRGSDESVSNIVDAITPASKAVLLANHGVLVFHRTLQQTMQVQFALEEAAQAGLYAMALGGPKPISPEMAAYAVSRAEEFARVGTVRPGQTAPATD